MTRKRRITLLAQGSLSVSLLAFLFTKVNLGELARLIRYADVSLLLAAVLQLALQPPIGALRWAILAGALGAPVPFNKAIKFVWLGAFVNQVLPGAVAGDVLRAWLHYREGASRTAAVQGVLLERLIMIATLMLLVAMVYPQIAVHDARSISSWTSLIALAIAAVALAILPSIARATFPATRSRILAILVRMLQGSAQVLSQAQVWLPAFALALVAYLNMIITAWLIALALHIDVTLLQCLILFPIALVASTLPISIGGWGIREGAVVALFATIHVGATEALALSVLFGLCGLLVSLPGSLLWYSRTARAEDLAAATELNAGEPPREAKP